jgi:hypothetical protein
VKVVHVARKPVEGTTTQSVLKWGVGALNIDGCRIGATKDVPWSPGTRNFQDLNKGWGFKATTGEVSGMDPNVGRHPANVILEHHADCRKVGTVTVPGYTINRWSDGSKPFGGGAGHPYEGEQMPDTEAPVWECAPSCPVAALNEQGLAIGAHSAGHTRSGSFGGEYAASSFKIGKGLRPMGRYGDSGGVSRFFKQVQE